jgi:hypothetical protein
MKRIEIGFAPKTVKLSDGTYLHFFYANNKGRGSNNCTIIRTANPNRMSASKPQYDDELATHRVQTSHWAGNVNFSKQIQEQLGL